MKTVLTERFYREYLTGLSNPESRVSYRELCCSRDLGSSSGARWKWEKIVRRRWKTSAKLETMKNRCLYGLENSRTRVSRTNFADESAKYHRRFPSKWCIFVRQYFWKRPANTPALIPESMLMFECDIPRRWSAKNRGERKITMSFITEFLEQR